MKCLLNVLLVIILWPSFLWLIGCSFASFVYLHNYFIVNIYGWSYQGRMSFAVVLITGFVIIAIIAVVNKITDQ